MKTWTALEGDVALIVDDVPENLALLSDALSEAGYWCWLPPTVRQHCHCCRE